MSFRYILIIFKLSFYISTFPNTCKWYILAIPTATKIYLTSFWAPKGKNMISK